MLACARIGAAHSVVFGGFSADSLRDRINDASARLLITADGGYRRGGVVPLKRSADEALEREGGCPSIETVLVVRRHGADGETIGNAQLAEGREKARLRSTALSIIWHPNGRSCLWLASQLWLR